ncbi:hypothetical protein Efla_004271 [Eimeria flavescens]
MKLWRCSHLQAGSLAALTLQLETDPDEPQSFQAFRAQVATNLVVEHGSTHALVADHSGGDSSLLKSFLHFFTPRQQGAAKCDGLCSELCKKLKPPKRQYPPIFKQEGRGHKYKATSKNLLPVRRHLKNSACYNLWLAFSFSTGGLTFNMLPRFLKNLLRAEAVKEDLWSSQLAFESNAGFPHSRKLVQFRAVLKDSQREQLPTEFTRLHNDRRAAGMPLQL